MLEVEDEVTIQAPLEAVWDALWNAERWPRITPHVTRVEMLERGESRQRFRMVVHSDGRDHTVETQRLGERGRSIRYRQQKPPVFLREHTGEWRLEEDGGGVRVVLIHRAVLDVEAAPRELGVGGLEEAAERVARALRRNGRTTLLAVKANLESTAVAPERRRHAV